MTNPLQEDHRSKILASGLDQESVITWINAVESIDLQNTLESDAAEVGTLIQQGWDFCNMLPFKTKRNPEERSRTLAWDFAEQTRTRKRKRTYAGR